MDTLDFAKWGRSSGFYPITDPLVCSIEASVFTGRHRKRLNIILIIITLFFFIQVLLSVINGDIFEGIWNRVNRNKKIPIYI